MPAYVIQCSLDRAIMGVTMILCHWQSPNPNRCVADHHNRALQQVLFQRGHVRRQRSRVSLRTTISQSHQDYRGVFRTSSCEKSTEVGVLCNQYPVLFGCSVKNHCVARR